MLYTEQATFYEVKYYYRLAEDSIEGSKRSSAGIWWTIIIAIVLLAVVLYIAYVYFYKPKAEQEAKAEPFMDVQPEKIEMQEHKPQATT